MANLVIVAIPQEDDYVWKISSEKVPHMTLCFLGDIEGKPVLKIFEFLQHAVDIMKLGPFGLDVDFRGVLGPDEADVLFFRKDWSFKRIGDFRQQILKENNIRNAYDSVAQYPLWTPHLTLGYPETPAKEDPRDYPGTHWVQFDKIALWFGDFEGPEIQLTLDFEDDPTEVAMSIEAGEAFISHHGVKGMKWGVRNRRGTPAPTPARATPRVRKHSRTTVKTKGGQSHPATEDAIKAALAKQKLKKSGHAALSNTELQELANRLNLESQVSQLIKRQPQAPAKALVTAAIKNPQKTVANVKVGAQATKDVAKIVKKGHKIVRGRFGG